ncbi:HlyD family type I secretion periplasmic adaptor subunit [Aliivibrio salmonicida]|jgi:adhesin transport system membrane fusion protein|uniref:Membrane fusion protein (MFP) family protein n=1 Tax=Aliivibrio salmonicida (strain LFI1238) TaxID=316275 RepID=B6EPY9_ALISL|nr:HlyD family type I secretion periplasmic adaptor subunit [Aliivibrio salmonicida]AZL87106.1 HlyD family type I secretion periplasmic adaptor subunit [Aliivibrio salmonicida]CAQ81855.1 secretion protein, HlyD family [Aliivibrio salmonicida LFI1238]
MNEKGLNRLKKDELEFVDDKTAALLLNTPTNAKILLWIIAVFFCISIAWASWAEIDKVTVGQGKVIPSSQLQIVQNLEGGLVKDMLVKEGDQVTKGQQLLLIDDTRFRSDFRERKKQLINLTASAQQLSASMDSILIQDINNKKRWKESVIISNDKLVFDDEFKKENPIVAQRQMAEYRADMNNLKNRIYVFDQQVAQKQQDLLELKSRVKNLQKGYGYARKELAITKPLADEGVVPRIELLKLQRQLNDTKRELTSTELKIPVLISEAQETILNRIDAALKFRSEQQEKLNTIQDKLSALTESQVGLKDKVNRTVVLSPVTGTIKKIYINTVGGVIQPGMDLIEIVPTEDTLLIEAKIAPQDIAFLRPGLSAIVKFSAYDFTRYGGLKGVLEFISADTIQDEEGNSFYLVRIRTSQDELAIEKQFLIIPGMTASVDVITGKRSILDYLLKPIVQAKSSALRE